MPEPVLANPEPIVYGQQAALRGPAGAPIRMPHLGLPPRAAWRLVYWSLRLVVPITLLFVGTEHHQPGVAPLGLALLIPRIGYPVSLLLSSGMLCLLVRTIRCPGCQEDHEAVGRWRCACGYQDHRERHFFGFRCPVCKSILGRTDYLRCGSTILVR